MVSYLVTGAARGLGLAFVQKLVALPAEEVCAVFATARTPSPELQELVKQSSGRVVIIKLEVTDEASIKQAAVEVEKKLGGKGLDVLINNAGVCQYTMDGVKSMDDLEHSFSVNVLGVHWVTRAFIPLLQKGTQKKVISISTTLASITLARAAHVSPAPAYKITKAAMNALTVQYALDYEKEGFTFMALSPGWLKTELGGGDMADLTAEEGAALSLDIIRGPARGLNGQFPKIYLPGWENTRHQYDGSNAPW
ncbi:SDR family oxidoreductase [Aspergillus mulundensis]|uniref:Short chain oxidoreductase n=1 Tax=Aspergillus mulundensis TaxID=1810919 RepID=A0A3D8S441_9EURO|nr:hypothetical protein DSM5745_04592 [Aspergillus mulundensis]RDW81035.1 hypothetical protein DSM5745_04592 [Aspergillus mulundensis]